MPEKSEKSRKKPEETTPPAEDKKGIEASEKREKIKQGIDEILDEIDGLLEENAEEFVKSYVQRGGE